MARRWRQPPRGFFGIGAPEGYRPLRVAIAEYLKSARGVRCEADQILILNGSQQALDITARVLLDPDDVAWVEDPGYLGDHAALIAAGARFVGVPVDREGIIVERGIQLAPRARLAFVKPSHQYPLGMTMSLARRFALLDWARRAGAWIVEDDYDSEYRYCCRPLASLQGLDTDGRVVYTGSFSKVLASSLRLGYAVVPPELVDAFARARAASDRTSPTLEQVVLADFINEGHFARHIRRTRTLYEARRDALVAAAKEYLDGMLDLKAPDGGMQAVGWLQGNWDDRVLASAALGENVEAPAVSDLYLKRPKRGGFVLGFASVDEDSLVAGVRGLAKVFERTRRMQSAAS